MRYGVPVAPPEVGLCTRKVATAAIDPTFCATVLEAGHLVDMFSSGDGLICDNLLRKFLSSRDLTNKRYEYKKYLPKGGGGYRMTNIVRINGPVSNHGLVCEEPVYAPFGRVSLRSTHRGS